MDKELIEKYLQTSIDNGFKFGKEFWYSDGFYSYEECSYTSHDGNYIISKSKVYNLIELITSKEFIEAIVNYHIRNNIHTLKAAECNVQRTIKVFGDKFEKEITIEQAIAIRDNKLEDFITKVLGNT